MCRVFCRGRPGSSLRDRLKRRTPSTGSSAGSEGFHRAVDRATISEDECPYLGLKTFQPEDARLFFGRAAKIQELLDRLRNSFGTPKEERFLALIGALGSGKSSLALAGLIPAIERGELSESAAWQLVRCRPGAHPWESLQIALAANQKIVPHLVVSCAHRSA